VSHSPSGASILVHNAQGYSANQQLIQQLVNEATNQGHKPLTRQDANVVLDWAKEYEYPGVRAGPGDVGYGQPSHWVGGPHINMPGMPNSGHVPVEPGLLPRAMP
jgi:hypothetical protein